MVPALWIGKLGGSSDRTDISKYMMSWQDWLQEERSIHHGVELWLYDQASDYDIGDALLLTMVRFWVTSVCTLHETFIIVWKVWTFTACFRLTQSSGLGDARSTVSVRVSCGASDTCLTFDRPDGYGPEGQSWWDYGSCMKKTGGYSVEEISLHDDSVKHCWQYGTCAVATVDVACDYFHYVIRSYTLGVDLHVLHELWILFWQKRAVGSVTLRQ